MKLFLIHLSICFKQGQWAYQDIDYISSRGPWIEKQCITKCLILIILSNQKSKNKNSKWIKLILNWLT